MTSLLALQELVDDLSIWPLPSRSQEGLPRIVSNRIKQLQECLSNVISDIAALASKFSHRSQSPS